MDTPQILGTLFFLFAAAVCIIMVLSHYMNKFRENYWKYRRLNAEARSELKALADEPYRCFEVTQAEYMVQSVGGSWEGGRIAEGFKDSYVDEDGRTVRWVLVVRREPIGDME